MPVHRPQNLHELPRLEDRVSYVYVEMMAIDRHDQAVVATDATGSVHIPCANLAALICGPGTTITHAAVLTVADHGCSLIWTGESGVRFYAAGTPATRSTTLLEAQARLWADPTQRLRVARRLYLLRFPGEALNGLSLNQLRGREGARVRRAYRAAADTYGVPWAGRSYDPDNWHDADPINRALSAANACLYGICHAGICLLGCSPDLGFIHTGKAKSFVYDLADLYKVDVTIPAAFAAVASRPPVGALERAVRRAVRDHSAQYRLLDRIVTDLKQLFGTPTSDETYDTNPAQPGVLWDPDHPVLGGVNWADDEEPWS